MSTMTQVEREVWDAWNTLVEGNPAPVKTIAARLGMSPADVAFVVLPAEHFGPWDDSREPDVVVTADGMLAAMVVWCPVCGWPVRPCSDCGESFCVMCDIDD